ncbi:MAG: DUF411 domain-containing protein [Aquificota bacterium]|nr:DUF411 domain-containing protein [Aquificota bacterium]
MRLLVFILVFGLLGIVHAREITAYYNPKCSCCHKYFKILEEKGYKVKRVEVEYPELYKKKDELGVPVDKRSCHTMRIGDKFIEGHVPVEGIEALLKSDAKGVYSPHGVLSGMGKEEEVYILIE